MKLKQSWPVLLSVCVLLLISLWWGIPTFRKAKADAMVDELCAKDGGTKVYETVKLPANRFDQHGNVRLPFEPKPGEEYYLKLETQWIVPYTGEGNISIAREGYKIYRITDNKLLGRPFHISDAAAIRLRRRTRRHIAAPKM